MPMYLCILEYTLQLMIYMKQKIGILLDFFVYRMRTKITLGLYIVYSISFFKVAFCLKCCPYVCMFFIQEWFVVKGYDGARVVFSIVSII